MSNPERGSPFMPVGQGKLLTLNVLLLLLGWHSGRTGMQSPAELLKRCRWCPSAKTPSTVGWEPQQVLGPVPGMLAIP